MLTFPCLTQTQMVGFSTARLFLKQFLKEFLKNQFPQPMGAGLRSSFKNIIRMKTNNSILGFTLLLAVLLSPSCEYFKPDNFPPPDCQLDTPFWLWYGQSAECDELNITFTGDIQDSRCPTTVTCVWEGRVDVEVQVGNTLISLGLPNDDQLGQSKDTVGTHVIELLDVFPSPITADEIPNESYRVKLSVTEL